MSDFIYRFKRCDLALQEEVWGVKMTLFPKMTNSSREPTLMINSEDHVGVDFVGKRDILDFQVKLNQMIKTQFGEKMP